MPAFMLPEQDSAALRIREAATRRTLSHALLFTGGANREAAARYAAAAMECTGQTVRPCGQCENCRKVAADIHPDVVTVRDGEHKNLPVELVREMRIDAYIRPNEGERKVYLFPDCALLTEQCQNVLLKIVEEGPPYAAFLFCAENSNQVLSTLRSRCVELKLAPGGAAAEENAETADALCRALGAGRPGTVTELMVRLERKKISREALSSLLSETRTRFAVALLQLYGQESEENFAGIAVFLAKNLTKTQIMRTIELLQTYQAECAYNVGVGHVLGALAVELEGIL